MNDRKTTDGYCVREGQAQEVELVNWICRGIAVTRDIPGRLFIFVWQLVSCVRARRVCAP